ncbi:dihydrolipoamide acetyltransferase component of pyruvate dehydrogenase complex [Thermogemmatispora aurantia]|jgi:pyruvate dehydrogenase E2 component (dihydrolipoamide acetyltransferase)|uniref:Dihydrolipoamide acetyltransferase component of pyruvate dehydrogenase complex n=1 Tax=Thermogemmatispora aurantia TaxID=2045279 RepID=A0A5J4K7V1_9CHLR|nr:dihydrolipoamide acetyltransferase family protein [Thermogemmatispora aurantia]GER83625.1 dihydrolipoamide acetyltransferase component of pyruvate dehydrogenase complex [Thermogemmatispora aurantia]
MTEASEGAQSEVIMPRLGLTMQEGTIVQWSKPQGGWVNAGEVVCTIETEKITHEIEAPRSGYLQILQPEGTAVAVGAVIARILAQREAVTVGAARAVETPGPGPGSEWGTEKQPDRVPPAVPRREAGSGDGRGRLEISPVALRMAQDLGLPLERIQGSGPRGRIHKADVLRAWQQLREESSQPAAVDAVSTASPPAAMAPVQRVASLPAYDREPLTPMRRRIAEHMLSSLQETAQLTLMMEADVTQTLQLRAELQQEQQRLGGTGITITHLLIKMVALALREHRRLNAALVGDEIRLYREINIGVATALEDGLLVPVIREADRKSLAEISAELQSLAEQARSGRLPPDALAGATFTVTNLGAQGVDYFTPILPRGQGAVLGVGRVCEQVRAGAEGFQRYSRLGLSLTFDHRLVDGEPAARFLARVKYLLEHPWTLLLSSH